MPGFPVHHQLPEPTQTHVQCVSDAIQISNPLSSPSPPAFNLSLHQGLSQIGRASCREREITVLISPDLGVVILWEIVQNFP